MTQTSTTITVDSLPIASTIDPVQDRLLIYTASATDIQGINRNVLLGLSSQPVGISDSQSLSNKTIGNTNSLAIQDSNFTLQDNGDTSKQAQFQLSGITTSTTRTYSLPNTSDTLVTLAATQTLTNKTLTSPAISGGTIDNSTVTVDSIAGHTTSNSGSIYGITVSAGAISSALSVTNTLSVSGATTSGGLLTASNGFTLSSGTLTLPNSSITTNMIAAAAVTVSKRAGGFFAGSFTITATGAKAITGVGFTPKAVLFLLLSASSTTTSSNAFGFTDGTNNFAANSSTDSTHFQRNSSSAKCIEVRSTANVVAVDASMTSFDADGFTLNVTTHTSDQTLAYIALG